MCIAKIQLQSKERPLCREGSVAVAVAEGNCDVLERGETMGEPEELDAEAPHRRIRPRRCPDAPHISGRLAAVCDRRSQWSIIINFISFSMVQSRNFTDDQLCLLLNLQSLLRQLNGSRVNRKTELPVKKVSTPVLAPMSCCFIFLIVAKCREI
jgi:hypothetical protein